MKRTVYRARILTALLFLVLGLVTLWQSADLPVGSLRSIRAGFFPVLFGGLLTGLSVLMLASLMLARRRKGASAEETDAEGHEASEDPEAPEESDGPEGPETLEEHETAGAPGNPVRRRGVLAFAGVFVLFLVLTHGAGFLAASFVTLLAAGYLLGQRGWPLVVQALATTVIIWFIFDWWMGIALPPGVWM